MNIRNRINTALLPLVDGYNDHFPTISNRTLDIPAIWDIRLIVDFQLEEDLT